MEENKESITREVLKKGYCSLTNITEEELLSANDLIDVYQYFNPLGIKNVSDRTDIEVQKNSIQLLGFLGVTEQSDDVFIFTNENKLYFCLIVDDFVQASDVDKTAGDLMKNIPIRRDWGVGLFSPFNYEPENDDDYHLNLDEEAQGLVKDLTDRLRQLNEAGQFLAILPFLEKQIHSIKEQTEKVLSPLLVDEDYRIFLTDYGNVEVKLSHLTKSLYFLFLLEPQIHLADLKKHYKKDLFTIYKHISHQENLERMEESVDQLLSSTNEIYVHFSRIKSAFCKVISEDLARKYYIKGGKNQPKAIELEQSLHNIDKHEQIWFSKRVFSTYHELELSKAFNDVRTVENRSEDD